MSQNPVDDHEESRTVAAWKSGLGDEQAYLFVSALVSPMIAAKVVQMINDDATSKSAPIDPEYLGKPTP